MHQIIPNPLGGTELLRVSVARHLDVVLVLLPEPRVERWVTWLYNKDCPGYGLGHYFDNGTDAVRDWESRVRAWGGEYAPPAKEVAGLQ